MGAITPSFVFDLESNMKAITTREYDRLARNLWWQKVAKKVSIKSKRERLVWMLETAKIEVSTRGGGQAKFDELVTQTMEIETANAVAGLTLKYEQMVDLENGIAGGEAMRVSSAWSRQVGAHAAYWPQKLIANAIKANPLGYDGQPFFSSAHPVNPFRTEYGTFANVFTGAASGSYPGALPIGTGTIEAAQANVSKAIAYIASIKQANGEDPRGLRVSGIVVPPALMERAVQITQAKFVSQTDVSAITAYQGLGMPIQADELGAGFGGSDTDYYLLAEEISSDELGAFAYVEREPFSVLYHDQLSDAELARKREFQWTTEGRNATTAGHPYLLFRCRAT